MSNKTRAVGKYSDSVTPLETIEGFESLSAVESEIRFRQMIKQYLDSVTETDPVDIVIGIPFINEAETITSIVQTAREGLEKYYPDQKAIIAAIGSPAGSECLKVFNAIPESESIRHVGFLLDDERVNGKGWATRAAMEIGQVSDADLIVLEADLISVNRNGEPEGLSNDWIHLLLEPIKRGKKDLVVSRFIHHSIESPISSQLIYPLLATIYDCPVHDSLGGLFGISHNLLHSYLDEPFLLEGSEIGGYGIDVWLITKAVTKDARICESNLGIKIPGTSQKMELILHHATETIFERIVADSKYWSQYETDAETPLLNNLDTFGIRKDAQPTPFSVDVQKLISNYRRGFNKLRSIYSTILPDDTFLKLESMVEKNPDDFQLSGAIWVNSIYHILLAFAFHKEFSKGDLVYSIIPLFEGRLAAFSLKMQSLSSNFSSSDAMNTMEMMSIQAEHLINLLVDEFLAGKQDFLTKWKRYEEEIEPPVPKVTYREFIPGVPLVVPLEVDNPDRGITSANTIYENLFARYKVEFDDFIYNKLKIPRSASSIDIVKQINTFMIKTEKLVNDNLLPGELSTISGTRNVAENILHAFHKEKTFALTPDFCYRIIMNYPPSRLLTRLGFDNVRDLLKEYEPLVSLALACISEEPEYQEKVSRLLRQTLTPKHFRLTQIEAVIVDCDQFPTLIEMKELGGMCKLIGKVVMGNLWKGIGGKFPKLRYLTFFTKNLIEIERYGKIWQSWTGNRRDFADRVINSLENHWGKEPLSAHNIFENGNQRILVKRINELTQDPDYRNEGEHFLELAENLKILIDSYHLAISLPDGVFIPCSAWSWASYSYKGGIGLPTPLSLHVERDWTSHEFLKEYYVASGGREEDIEKKVIELMGQGREYQNLSPILLGVAQDTDAVIEMERTLPENPPAGMLTRCEKNPVLEPIKDHSWESKYVLNPGAVKINGKVYLVYRAFGDDNISRLGLAVSDDGITFSERLDKPIFEPINKYEEKGCEDARLTLIGDSIYMIYTAYSEAVAQIGMARIPVKEFINYNWKEWQRLGLVFPGFSNKDGILFSDRFDGKYVMLHRVDPHIWIAFSPNLRCPFPKKDHRILTGATYGMMWEGKKIGGGSPPIKTKYGWLLIIHGVDHLRIYRLGLLLLDLNDPSSVIYRSPNAILEPKERYEEGEAERNWVPNVVFTCGAVPVKDNREILDADDEILVYYGAADSVIGVARARIGNLIPSAFLNSSH